MIAPARVAASEILQRVELRQAHSDDALNSTAMAGLETRDRNLATEIVYGTLRWRGWLDYILESAVERGWEKVHPKAKILLRLSLYQISRMDRLPDHAVIHDAVELAKQQLPRQASGFVNGVLRNLARQRPWKTPDFHRASVRYRTAPLSVLPPLHLTTSLNPFRAGIILPLLLPEPVKPSMPGKVLRLRPQCHAIRKLQQPPSVRLQP